jgi:hypothetical protein
MMMEMCEKNSINSFINNFGNEVGSCITSLASNYKPNKKDKSGKVIDDKNRNGLDVLIEKGVGTAFIYLFLGVIIALRFILLLIPYGIKEAKNRHNKTDISIIIIDLIVTLLIALYLINNITVIAVLFILSAIMLRGLVFFYQKFIFDSVMKDCKIMSNNHKYPRLRSIRYEGMSKIFVLNSSIPSSKFIMQVSKLSNSLNTNITLLSLVNKSLLVYTNTHENINPEYLRIEKFKTVFDSLELKENIEIKNYEDTEYYTNVYFNSEIYKSKLVGLLPEIEHRLKVSNLELLTDPQFDFRLVMKKTVNKLKTFLANWDSAEVQNKIKNMIIPILLGVNCETGKIAVLDMAKDMIHGIFAGTTGWGKSVSINNVISSILLSNRSNVRMVLLDTKGSELDLYKGLKNVIFESDLFKIVEQLELLVDEIRKRNEMISEKSRFIKNIHGYNKETPNNKMDFIVCVIEEISFFMESSDDKLKKRFESAVVKILQVGRSAGIQLILTTQNPIAKVITSEMKANIESKAAFKTIDKTKSRTILDNNSAYLIDEKGKFVFQNQGKNVIHKSFFINDEESELIYNRLKTYINKNGYEGMSKDIVSLEKSDVEGMRFDNTRENLVSLEKSNVDEGMRENNIKYEGMRISDHQDLYNFYISLQQKDNKLPVRKEREKLTQLTEWKLRTLETKLRDSGLIYNVGNDLLVNADSDIVHKLVANETNIIELDKWKNK